MSDTPCWQATAMKSKRDNLQTLPPRSESRQLFGCQHGQHVVGQNRTWPALLCCSAAHFRKFDVTTCSTRSASSHVRIEIPPKAAQKGWQSARFLALRKIAPKLWALWAPRESYPANSDSAKPKESSSFRLETKFFRSGNQHNQLTIS